MYHAKVEKIQGWLIFSILLALAPVQGLCQSKVEVDEEVKVLFMRDWYDGVVIEQDKRRILVEFYFVGDTPKREVFNRNQIRKLYEVEAKDFGRTWNSSNGNFTIDAALKSIDGENVTLIKPDLTELTVALDKLSTKDNSYVNKLKKNTARAIKSGATPAAVPELPDIEQFDSSFGSMATYTDDTTLQPLGAVPDFLKDFSQAGFGFRLIREKQDLIAAIPVGGPDELVLMTSREHDPFNKRPFFQSQLYWVSLKKSKILASVPIAHEDFAVDYDPRHRLLLTYNRHQDFIDKEDDPDHYTLWKLEVGGEKAQPLIRWEASGATFGQNFFSKIINDRIVLSQVEPGVYEAWDVSKKTSVYSIRPESFFTAPIVLSHDRKSLIVPEDGRVNVIDALTGKPLFTRHVDDRHISAANVNADGTKLAALTEQNIYVWELNQDRKDPLVYPAPLVGSPFQSRIEWIGDDYILGESHLDRVLYSLKLKLPVWSYILQDKMLNRDPLKNQVVDGMFFYVAEESAPQSKTVAIGAVQLPGPKVEEVTQNIDRESLLILKPGVHVGLEIENVSKPNQVRSWLVEKIEANQWIHDENAEIKLHANMGTGKQQTVQYREIGVLNGKTFSKSFTPRYATMELRKGNTIIWQTGTSTGAPPMIIGIESEIENRIADFQGPQIGFFENVEIPPKIIDSKYGRGFGVSELGTRGLQVVSTTPPGRADDPGAAALQAEAERLEELKNLQDQATNQDDSESDEQ